VPDVGAGRYYPLDMMAVRAQDFATLDRKRTLANHIARQAHLGAFKGIFISLKMVRLHSISIPTHGSSAPVDHPIALLNGSFQPVAYSTVNSY
jgi:hypothetical protein